MDLELVKAGKITNRRANKPKQLSVSTLCKLHALLPAMFTWAAMSPRSYIGANPCIGTKLPKRKKLMLHGMMPIQWQTMRTAFEQLGYDDAGDLGTFLIGSGRRISEAAALPVENVED